MLNRRNLGLTLTAGAALVPGTVMAQLTPPPSAPPSSGSGSTWDQIIKRGSVRLGAINSEPWYFKDLSAPAGSQDAWKGIGPGIARQIATAMGVKLDIVETTWGGAVAGLQSNQFDMIFMLDGTPQRAMAIDFLQVPVVWYPMSALIRDGIKAVTWADLDKPDYNIGLTIGSTTEAFASETLKHAKLNRFATTNDNIASFQSGRTDAVILVAPGSDAFAAKLGGGSSSIVPKPAQWFAGGTGLRLEESRRWKDYLTTCVIYMYNGGQTQKIYEDYLSFRGIDPLKVHPLMRSGDT